MKQNITKRKTSAYSLDESVILPFRRSRMFFYATHTATFHVATKQGLLLIINILPSKDFVQFIVVFKVL